MSQLVTVIIPTFKRSGFLAKAIQSVNCQTYHNIEVIIIDDNTEIKEIEKVKGVAKKWENVKYIKNYRTKGGCGARNTGILEAKGDLIAFLDDDDLWLKSKISEQVDAIKENNDAVLISCDFVKKDLSKNTESVRRLSSDTFTQKDIFRGECPASTSLILAKRKILLDAGLFDENLPSFQDFDMWIRCLEFGYLINVPKPLAVFVEHDGERTSINLKKRLNGLDLILDKWEKEIKKNYSVNKFKKKFKSSAYFNYSKHTLEDSIMLSSYYNLLSVYYNPYNIKYWIHLLLVITGTILPFRYLRKKINKRVG